MVWHCRVRRNSVTYPELAGAEVLERACASTAAVLAAVGAADLDLPTPCRSWTVKDVINHVIGSAASYADLAETGVMPAGGSDADHTAGDFGGAFARQAGRVVAGFSVPGAMDTIMEMPFGGMPGSVCVWIAAGDIFTHGWDLARATGQPSDLDPELAERLLARIERLLPDTLRGPEGQAPFGPKVEVAGSAPAADRLAAFEGRRP
jgi:uncharacterized protein (TIGR03086 family)